MQCVGVDPALANHAVLGHAVDPIPTLRMDPDGGGQLAELAVHVLPLADAQEVQVLVLAQASERARSEHIALIGDVVPERDDADEVAAALGEPAVRGVGLLLLIDGALAHVLHREGRDDDHDLVDHAEPVCFQEHAAKARIDRELREPAADLSEARGAVVGWVGLHPGGGCARRHPLARSSRAPARPAIVARILLRAAFQRDGAQFSQQGDAVSDRADLRWFDEREPVHPAEAQRGHLEDDGGKRCAQDFRLGELGALEVVLFGVQPDRDAVGHTATSARALVRAGLGDRFDGQALHLGAGGVARDAGVAGVDHVANAGNGEAGFGHVRGDDHAAIAVRFEDAVLFGRG